MTTFRMKRSTLSFCLNGRDCSSSSMPVRYIPKKNSGSDDQGKESLKRRNVEKKAFDKNLAGVRSFSSDKKSRNRKPIRTRKRSFDNAPQEHLQLRKKLLGKRFPTDVVEALITNFQHRGLINDSLYAETFSRSRWSSSTWGPRRIKQALYKKGVSNEDAEKALELVFHDSEPGGEGSNMSLSKASVDYLLAQASKQWLRGKDVSKETRKSRIVRWLQYRGFNWDTINIVLRKLESQHPP